MEEVNHAKCALINPPPYRGRVPDLSGKRKRSVIEAATLFDYPPLVRRCGTWAVTERSICCLTTKYEVDVEMMRDEGEEGAEQHVLEKPWCVKVDFTSALGEFKRMFNAGYFRGADSTEERLAW